MAALRLLRHASRPGLQKALRRVQRRGIAAQLRHAEQGVGHARAAYGRGCAAPYVNRCGLL